MIILNQSHKSLYLFENKMNTDDMLNFQELLSVLNLFNKEKLKKYNIDLLTNSPMCSKSTIGLICVRRKSNNKILYNFTKIDDKSSLVSLITTIDVK